MPTWSHSDDHFGKCTETQDEDMTVPEIEEEAPLEVYLPGQQMDEDEELVVDNSAYDMLHQMGVEWPCLSFDVLPDALGMARKKYPMTAYLVAGSQADSPKNNALYVMKMSSLHRTKHDDDDEASEDEDENDLDEDPILEYKTIPHFGGVNRVRVMPHQDSQIVAVWSDQGHVGIYDVSAHTRALDSPGLSSQKDLAPVHTVKAHKSEGYAMDWSRQRLGHLLTGDSDGHIYLTTRTASAFVTEETPFLDHTSSVEDIQFSPSQSSVFASASADMTIKIWDLRTRNRAQLSVKAHDTDVNVISWNRYVIRA